MSELPILFVLAPLAGAFVCLLSRSLPALRLAGAAAFVSLLWLLALLFVARAPLAASGSLSYALGGWSAPLGIELRLDGISWLASLLGAVVGLAAVAFAWGEGRRDATFYFLFLMLVTGLEAAILTTDIFNLFVAVEILSVSTYLLIASGGHGTSLRASLNYLLISSLGMTLFLVGALLAYNETGSLSMPAIAASAARGLAPAGRTRLVVGIAAMAIGVGVKAALVPVHAWLPDAHASAPHAVSAMLSAVMLKVSFLATVRLLALAGAARIERLLLWVGAATALVAVVYALAQTDAKRLLAYHSVSQMGYIAAAYGAATAASRTASLYHLASHALFKSLLFLVVGALIQATGQRRIGSIRLSRRIAWQLAPPYLVGALAITGMPPFNGHISKALVSAALKGEPAYALVLIAGFGTVASFLKLAAVFVPAGGEAETAEPRVPPTTTAALAGLSLLCLATGIAPGFWASRLAALGAELGAGAVAAGYTLEGLRSSAITLSVGAALYALVRSRGGQRVLRAVRGLEPGLNGALALVLAGFVGLGLAASLAAGAG